MANFNSSNKTISAIVWLLFAQFMHISFDGFVAGPSGEMNRIKVNEEIFDHAGKRISEGEVTLHYIRRVTYEMMKNYLPTAADKPKASKHDIEN